MPDQVEPESLATAARTKLFSPFAALEEHASRQAAAPAIVLDAQIITFGECLERVTSFAGWLLQNGLAPGEATGICIRGELAHIYAAMSVLCLGTPQICLGAHENGVTKRALADKVGVTQLIVDAPEEWMEGRRVIIVPQHVECPPDVPAKFFVSSPLAHVGVFQNTSGSTSVPKTFGFSYERLLTLASRYFNDPHQRRALRFGSIEFDAHRLARICALLAGNCSVFLHNMTLRGLIEQCELAEVTSMSLGVYALSCLLKAEIQHCRKLPSFTTVHSGGSRVPGALRRDLRRFFTDNLYVLYATSEVGTISRATPDQHEIFPEGVGFPWSGVTVEVVGLNGEQVAPGEIGQLRLRKSGVPDEYIAEPRDKSNFQDGWFYPRDLLSYREGEPLIYHGRSDDVMILNSINVFPSAIEDVLESHPDVLEAVAYSVESRVHGEIPVAAVVLKDSALTRDSTHLLALCRKKLGIRAPRQIRVVDKIPRNAAGKPLRRELSGS